MRFLVLAVLVVAQAVLAKLGVDVSTAVSQGSFTCLKNSGYEFAIVRAWRNNGQADTNAAQTYKNAVAAGYSDASFYMSPCYTCGDPQWAFFCLLLYCFIDLAKFLRGQVQRMISNLTANGVTCVSSGMWVDVVSGGSGWSSNSANNIGFLRVIAWLFSTSHD